jgi:hypothetical protein
MKNKKKKTTVLKSILLYILALRIYWHRTRADRHQAVMLKHSKKYDLLQLTYHAGHYSHKKFFARIRAIKANVKIKDGDEKTSMFGRNKLPLNVSVSDIKELEEKGVIDGNN